MREPCSTCGCFRVCVDPPPECERSLVRMRGAPVVLNRCRATTPRTLRCSITSITERSFSDAATRITSRSSPHVQYSLTHMRTHTLTHTRTHTQQTHVHRHSVAKGINHRARSAQPCRRRRSMHIHTCTLKCCAKQEKSISEGHMMKYIEYIQYYIRSCRTNVKHEHREGKEGANERALLHSSHTLAHYTPHIQKLHTIYVAFAGCGRQRTAGRHHMHAISMGSDCVRFECHTTIIVHKIYMYSRGYIRAAASQYRGQNIHARCACNFMYTGVKQYTHMYTSLMLECLSTGNGAASLTTKLNHIKCRERVCMSSVCRLCLHINRNKIKIDCLTYLWLLCGIMWHTYAHYMCADW